MSHQVHLLCILAVLGSSLAQDGSPPESPCPAVFKYSHSPSQGWHGIISIVPPLTFSEVQLVLRLAVSFFRPDTAVGKVEVLGGDTEVQNIANRASQKQRQTIQYLVTFPPYKEFPRISSVKINGNEFCSVPAYSDARGVIELKYTLKTGLALTVSNSNDFSVDGGYNSQPVPSVPTYPQPQQPQQPWVQPPQQPQQPWVQPPQQPQQPWMQQPQQTNRPDKIANVGDKNAHQIATGRPPQGADTNFNTHRPNPTGRPAQRPKPTPGPIVFPDTANGEDEHTSEVTSSPMDISDLFPEFDPSDPKVVIHSYQVLVNSISNGELVKTARIEKLLEKLVTLVQYLAKTTTQNDKRKRKGSKREQDDVDDDE